MLSDKILEESMLITKLLDSAPFPIQLLWTILYTYTKARQREMRKGDILTVLATVEGEELI
jgi:hypothetical protein